MTALYDTIGKSYDATRQADPEIADRIASLIAPTGSGSYLDVACGSGNYSVALAQQGLQITGLDISYDMLQRARAKRSNVNWVQGDAKAMPFDDESFDGLFCTLAIHHIRHLPIFFNECYRILKPGGRALIFTNTPDQFAQIWFIEYFPKMVQAACERLFTQTQIESALVSAGFNAPTFEPYFMTSSLKDAFIEAAKFRPELLLSETFRANSSAMALAPDKQEIQDGVARLAADVASGKINDVMARYPNPDGNFFYLVATRPA